MNILPGIFKFVFRFKFLQKYYFGFYKRLFKPFQLFKGKSAVCKYDKNLKMKVDIDEWIQQHVYFFGMYDISGINFIKSILKKDDIFIDIGANVGCFSLIASELVGENGSVHAFEPVKYVADRLEYNLSLNNIENVSIVRKAVFDKVTTLDLFVSSQENLGMSSILRHDTESGESEKVSAIDLDSYISDEKINKVKLIKIDIEGAEIFALEGMKESLKKFKPHLLIEVSNQVLKHETDRNKIFDLMKDLEYKRYGIDEEGSLVDINANEDSFTNFVFTQIKHNPSSGM